MDIVTQNQTIADCLNHTLFSWKKQAGLKPIHIKRAEGVYLYDNKGNRILDFSSQLMNVNIGHSNKKVIDAIHEQASKMQYVYPGMATDSRAQLGKKLAELAPGSLNKTFFTLGGAEAVENAIKLARVYLGRPKIISFYRSYHGATFAAMSAGGDPRKHAMEAFAVPHMIHVENPYSYRCPWGTDSPEACGEAAAQNIENVIKYENPDSIAAILMEGESGSSGCIKYPKGFWKRVKEIADKYGILIICDEVMSGFGRTGKMFAIEHHGVEPDMMCIAKGLTSGYLPLGGLIISDKIAKKFDNTPLPLGLTYSAHAVCCAAGVANLKVIEEENLVENAARMGHYVEHKVAELKEKHPSIGDFRNTGLLGAIELVKNRKTKEPITPWNANGENLKTTNAIAAKIAELGMFTFVRWNWIFVAPPLIVNEAQIDQGMEIISQACAIADKKCW